MKIIGLLIIMIVVAAGISSVGADPTNKSEWTGPTTVFSSPGGTYQYPNSSPAVTSRYPGEIDVFFFNTTNMTTTGSVIRQARYVFNGVDSASCWAYPYWTDVGAPLVSGTNPLSATSINPNRIDLFSRGSGGYLYQTTYTSPSWSASWSKPDERDFAIVAHTGPMAISPSASTQDVFWISPDYHVRWMHWNGASWEYSTSGSYNGTDLGTPPPGVNIDDGIRPGAAASPGHPERIDVFVHGQDNQVWQKTRMGTTWNSWTVIPGGSPIIGPPSAVSRYPGCIDLFYGTPPSGGYLISASIREWNASSGWGREIRNVGLSQHESPIAWSPYRMDILSIEPQLCWGPRWNSPLPQILSLTGSMGSPGDSMATITITGKNFFPGSSASIVHYRTASFDKNLTTIFINETCLWATLPSVELESPANITVINPSDGILGGGTSNAVVYDVVFTSPSIDGTVPSFSPLRDTGYDMLLNGRNFYNGISKVYVNGVMRSSATWQAPTQYFVPLTAFEVNHVGALNLEVRTPEPGGVYAYSNLYRFYISNPDSWLSPGGHTLSCVAVDASSSTGEVFAAIRGTDNHVYFNKYTSATNSWSGWMAIGGTTYDEPVVAYTGNNYVHVVIRGTNNALYYKKLNLDTATWDPTWTSLGGTISGAPTLISMSGAQIPGDPSALPWLWLAVRGTDNHVYTKQWTPSSGWEGTWRSWGGTTNDRPALALSYHAGTGSGTLTLGVRGMDNKVYTKDLPFTSSGPGPLGVWTSPGGSTLNSPVIRYKDDILTIVVRGTDNHVYYKRGSDPYAALGGTTADVPAVYSWPDQPFFEISVRGMDSRVYNKILNLNAHQWTGWTFMKGSTASHPVLSRGPGSNGLLAIRGTDNGIYAHVI